jgi:thiamine biosynthesis lipoprotein
MARDWVEDGIMGTRIHVELWADDPAKGQAAIEAVLDEMRRVDESMSTYKPTSEVSMVNAHAAQGPVKISEELFDLLNTALDYSRVTDGAFDITYASVGYLYDFRKHVHPDENTIQAALPGVNYRHVVLDPAQHTVRFTQPGVRIDLGGIGKGHWSTAGSRSCKDAALRAPSSQPAATAASSATGSASRGSSAFVIRIARMK